MHGLCCRIQLVNARPLGFNVLTYVQLTVGNCKLYPKPQFGLLIWVIDLILHRLIYCNVKEN